MKALKIWIIALLVCFFAAGGSAHAQSVSSAAPTTGSIFNQNLSIGTHGDDVSALQQFLIDGGYLKIATATGYFGTLTESALGAWQASLGISPAAGYFGPVSRAKINATISGTLVNTTSTQSAVEITTVTTEPTSTATVSDKTGLPVRLIIPTLNIDAGFQDTGLKSDGTMEVPSTIYVAGWFTDSVRPGEKGVAIVTGHVAQIRGGVVTKPGVFSNLYGIQVGDQLSITNDKGETIRFVVRKVSNYDPAADATDVFTSTDGGAHLNLITCEGTWNAAEASYSQRLVVFTDAVQ